MNTVPTTVATHDMNVARGRDNPMNIVQPTVTTHERISPENATRDNENYQLYVQASPRLSLGGVLEYGIHVCEYGRYVSGPEA